MNALNERSPLSVAAGQHHPFVAGGARRNGLTPLRTARRQAGSPGSAVFSDQVWTELIGRMRLSQREGEIVRGVFEDRTEFAIAADLGISPHTVHTHFERLHKKLEVMDRVQLVLCVTREYLRLVSLSNGTLPLQGNLTVVQPPCAPPAGKGKRLESDRQIHNRRLSSRLAGFPDSDL